MNLTKTGKKAIIKKNGNNRLGKKDVFNDDDLYYQALKEQNPDSFDGDYCTSKSLTAVLMSRMNQFTDTDNVLNQSVFAKKTDVSTKSDIKEMREDAKKYLLGVVRKQDIKHPTLGEIRVSRTGIDEFISHSSNKDKLALVPHLKELIETSVVGTEELPRHPRKDGIVAFIPLYNDAIIEDVPYNTKIWIGKDKKGNLFYDVKLESTETGGVENQSTVSSDALNMSITPETTNVKPLTQGTQANGYYDAELKVIVLGRNMNTMTLPHEMAHFWLDNTFSMFKKASKGELTIGQQWIDETNTLFGILGIDPQQETLTRSQQETFATMTEAVITGLAPVPDGATLPMTEYLNWIPEKYKSIAQIGFKNENGMIVHPVLDQSAVDFFNVWYGNMTLPPIPSSPARDSMTNPRDENGETIEQTLFREIKEELNMSVADWLPIGYEKVSLKDKPGDYKYALYVYAALSKDGEWTPDVGGDVIGYDLMDIQDIAPVLRKGQRMDYMIMTVQNHFDY